MAEVPPPGASGDGDDLGPEDFRELFREFLSGRGEFDPARLAGAAGLPDDPELIRRLVGQLQQALNRAGDGIDWGLALEQAKALAGQRAVPSTPEERAALEQALHIAELWLDEVTTISPLTTAPVLLTRAGWAEATMPVWTQLAGPVADSIANALSQALREQAPEELRELLGDADRIMRNVGGTLFAMQLGYVVGQLAGEAVSGGDVGIPLLDGETRQAALVPQNLREFGTGLDIPAEEVRIYLAVRELAHARLFRHAKWLRLHLLTQITDFARGIRIDTERIQELAADFDPRDPEELRAALSSGALIPPKSPEQLAALARLETMLALIEGWVDTVTKAATSRLPKAAAIAETVTRRRATGGPAEQAFSTLVGLELRPRRLREAAAMWQAVTDAVGPEARDALWAHPDLVPTGADIDDPSALVARLTADDPGPDDIDRAIEDLLDDTGGDRPRES